MRALARVWRIAILLMLLGLGVGLSLACGGAALDDKDIAGEISLSIDARLATQSELAAAPEDGFFLHDTVVPIGEDDTVLDVLLRVGKQEGIAVARQGSGRSAFVTGIGGLTAVDGKSGWIYALNGEVIQQSAGATPLKPGDELIWHYTLDLGNDFP